MNMLTNHNPSIELLTIDNDKKYEVSCNVTENVHRFTDIVFEVLHKRTKKPIQKITHPYTFTQGIYKFPFTSKTSGILKMSVTLKKSQSDELETLVDSITVKEV